MNGNKWRDTSKEPDTTRHTGRHSFFPSIINGSFTNYHVKVAAPIGPQNQKTPESGVRNPSHMGSCQGVRSVPPVLITLRSTDGWFNMNPWDIMEIDLLMEFWDPSKSRKMIDVILSAGGFCPPKKWTYHFSSNLNFLTTKPNLCGLNLRFSLTVYCWGWGSQFFLKRCPALSRWWCPALRMPPIHVSLCKASLYNLSLSVPSTVPLLVSCSLDVSLHLSPFICLPVCLVVSGSLDVSLPLSLKKSVTPMKRKAIIKSNKCLFHWGYGQPRKAPALTVVCFWPRNCVIKSTKSPEKNPSFRGIKHGKVVYT